MKSTTHIISLTQVVLGALTIWALACEWSLWWIPGIPWMILAAFGIILTMSLLFVMGAAGVDPIQADWMSDGFVMIVMIVCLVIPTILAVGVNYCFAFGVKARQRELQQIRAE